MSEANVELLRKIYDRLAEGDGELFWQSLDPSIVWDERDTAWPEAGVYRGTAELREMLRRWTGAWVDMRWLARDFADAGDNVVVTVRQVGKGRGSGTPVEQERSQVWRFRDCKVVAFRSYLTRSEAVEAAGLSEPQK